MMYESLPEVACQVGAVQEAWGFRVVAHVVPYRIAWGRRANGPALDPV